jgi:hypothetical protein
MYKTALFWFPLFIILHSSAQTPTNLDNANGFKTLKFGTPKNTFPKNTFKDHFFNSNSVYFSFRNLKEDTATVFGQIAQVEVAFDNNGFLYLIKLSTLSDIQTETILAKQSWYEKLLNGEKPNQTVISSYNFQQYTLSEIAVLKNTIKRAFGNPYSSKYIESSNNSYYIWQGKNVHLILEVGQFHSSLYSVKIYFVDIKRYAAEKNLQKSMKDKKDKQISEDF